MNPFDLRGPPFLGFYVMVGLAGLLFLYMYVTGAFSDPRYPTAEGRKHLRDPYLLAFLRGGVREALKTIAFSLHKRKLLSASDAGLMATRNKDALQAVLHPLEAAVLSRCSVLTAASEVVDDRRLKIAVENYSQPLRESGLVADDSELSRRLPAFLVVGGVMLGLSVIKLYLAFQRGRSNVAFLVILTVAVLIAAYAIYKRRRTNAGDRALHDQQTLFARLKNRVNRLAADGATDEAVLVAAAFGLAALPAAHYPFAASLKRQLQRDSSDFSSDCGSSCGGGGGGGGGCGGCGS